MTDLKVGDKVEVVYESGQEVPYIHVGCQKNYSVPDLRKVLEAWDSLQ